MKLFNNIMTGIVMIIPVCYWIIVGFTGLILTWLFGIIPMCIGGKNKKYVDQIAYGVDQLGNCLMAGDPDETISSRAGRRWYGSWWAKFINALFFWQKDHVKNAIETDEKYEDDLIR